MSIEKKDIEHIAYLARLQLKEEELEKMKKHFEEILEYVELLNELPQKPPELSDNLRTSRLRDDLIDKCISKESALKNASVIKDGLIVVPEVFTDDTDE
jgi:aspartyl-tRNA(Asn)/glutamyl-tRNA(Gln) amidotransferase subunit C